MSYSFLENQSRYCCGIYQDRWKTCSCTFETRLTALLFLTTGFFIEKKPWEEIHRRGREDWVSSRVGNYSKPRVLKEQGDLVDERPLFITIPSDQKHSSLPGLAKEALTKQERVIYYV